MNNNITNRINVNTNKYVITNNDNYVLDCSNFSNSILIENNSDITSDLLIINIKDNIDIRIEVKENSSLHVGAIGSDICKNIIINTNVYKNGEFTMHFADFLKENVLCKVVINLLEDGAKAMWHLASLAGKNDNKEFNVSINHKAINTVADSENFGVCKENSKLVFSGTSYILNKSIKSKTNQKAKIMVFDKDSIAIAKPILKIDENDIAANHAAVVGKISDEHLFYLQSRGLTENEAKSLITLGYLKPILNGFSDEGIKGEIISLIEGRI